MLRGSEINSNSKQQLISIDQPVCTTMGNILRENRYLPQDNGQMIKKLKLEKKSLFKNWEEISVRDVRDASGEMF